MPKPYRLTRNIRIRRRGEFDFVFATGRRATVGPITVHGCLSGRSRTRLGLAVSRRFGSAVKRNAFKRRIREAFRLNQHDLPQGYDLVVSAKPHVRESPDVYARLLREAVKRIAKQCEQDHRST